jgi:hypothetical protein
MFALLRRLRARLKYRHFDRDLARELEVHRAMKQEELETAGVPQADARARTSRALGNTALVREDARGVWVASWLQSVRQDVRYAIRAMWRQPGVTVTTFLTLTLALGLLTTTFAIFNALFLRPWPVAQPDSVFRITAEGPERSTDAFSLAGFNSLGAGLRNSELAAWMNEGFEIAALPDTPSPSYDVAWVTGRFVDIVGVPMQLGAGFTETSTAPTTVISDRVWRTVFAGDPAIIGRTAWLSGKPATVIGVMAPGFQALPPDLIDALVPLDARQAWDPAWQPEPETCCLHVAARLAAGLTRARALAELNAVALARLRLSMPRFNALELEDTTVGGRPGGLRSPAAVTCLTTRASGPISSSVNEGVCPPTSGPAEHAGGIGIRPSGHRLAAS